MTRGRRPKPTALKRAAGNPGKRALNHAEPQPPEGLPTWGDGRLTILGTEGYIELRKYIDVGGTKGTDHLILVNGARCEKVDASDAGLPYFARLIDDIRNRTETAMPQAHAYKAMELAIRAQMLAEGTT